MQHKGPLVCLHSMCLLLTALGALWIVALRNWLINAQHALQIDKPALPPGGDFGFQMAGSRLSRHPQGCLDLRFDFGRQLFAAAKHHFVGGHVVPYGSAFPPATMMAPISAESICILPYCHVTINFYNCRCLCCCAYVLLLLVLLLVLLLLPVLLLL